MLHDPYWHLTFKAGNRYPVLGGILQEKLADGTIVENYVEYVYKPDKYISDTGEATFVHVSVKILK